MIGKCCNLIFCFLLCYTATCFSQECSYDDLNRLTYILYLDGSSITYQYDKLGNRIGYEIDPACTKHVTSTLNEGSGTLREMINCAEPGDTITMDAALINQSLELAIPKIVVDKELYIQVDPSWNINWTNTDVSNTNILVEISDDLYVRGMSLVGTSPDAMILKLTSGGTLEIINAGIEKSTIQKQ